MKLEDKCLCGYWYTILDGQERGKISTGCGGAKEFIRLLRKEGLSDEIIGDLIIVYTDFGGFSLNQLKVNQTLKGRFQDFLGNILNIVSLKEVKKQRWYKAITGRFWKKGEGLCEQMKNNQPREYPKYTREEIIKVFEEVFKRK